MDHEFWEDENELPYLVWETRDDKRSKPNENKRNKSNEEKLDNILESLYISTLERYILREKLLSFFNSRDCVNLTVEDGFDGCGFIFTRQNRYIRTTDTFVYLSGSLTKRIFHDCYTDHDYSNLISDSRFQDMIERTGLEFMGCAGGYVTDYSGKDDEFTMADEPDVKVHLKAGSTARVYHLDLDRMELSKDFSEYSL